MFGPKLTRLRDLRLRSGLTQEELAARSGLHVKTCGNAERLVARPKLQTIQGIAAGLGVAPSELWRADTPQDVVALSASLNELVCQTLLGETGELWLEDRLVEEFRHQLNADDAGAEAVWRNVQFHAPFFASLSYILKIATWATATGNVPLLNALHTTAKTLIATSWRPAEDNGKGGDHASP